MQGHSATSRVNFRARSTLRCAAGIGILTMATFLAPVALGSPLMTYTYTGNDFTAAEGPYNTTDSVTGFFTYSALPENDDGEETFPTSYTFTDGVQTYDMGNSGSLCSSSGQTQRERSPDGSSTWEAAPTTTCGRMTTPHTRLGPRTDRNWKVHRSMAGDT